MSSYRTDVMTLEEERNSLRDLLQTRVQETVQLERLLASAEARLTASRGPNVGEEAKTRSSASAASGDRATTRCDFFQNWYRSHGFTVSVPLPPISDEEYKRREALGQAPFYRPSSAEVSYEALMKALGQGGHWTVVDENDRKKIAWEPAQTGYWFWAEVAESCPRLGTPWNTLTGEQKLNLLSLEEDAIVWHAHKADTGIMLDTRTWSWLRTRFGRSALLALECGGGVGVSGWDANGLSDSYGRAGGRCAEVVKM